MSEREERIRAFEKFYDDSNAIFIDFAKNDEAAKRLDDLYTFHVCPGGSCSGIDNRQIEIKYGSRHIDIKRKIGAWNVIQESSVLARGAALQYIRTDNGYVICSLYPAISDNEQPHEEVILLEILKKPSKLRKKVKRHWTYFISYMHATCIDGEPTILNRLVTFVLRYCKRYFAEGKLQSSKLRKTLKSIVNMSLTVGLSGFLLFGITRFMDSETQKENTELITGLRSTQESISNELVIVRTELENIREFLNNIGQNIEEALSEDSTST